MAAPPGAQAAQPLPAYAHTSVNDFAGVLSPQDTRTIDEALIALHRDTGVQGTVVTLEDRSRYGDASLDAFAKRLFNAWGVGAADRNDGFMVLLIPAAREARIELGAAYGRDRDIRAGAIMERVMLPSLRDGQMSQGLRDGTLAVINSIARPLATGTAPPPHKLGRPWFESLLPLAVFGVFGVTGLGMVRSLLRRRRGARCQQCGAKTTERIEPAPGNLPGGIATAGNILLRSCPACGWTARETVTTPVMLPAGRWGRNERGFRGFRGGGGGGGFGGGRSGGGGASGRW
ncbi:TPM domain-containing protein [Paracoccus suum]|uniref:TPM domain-containing protein n=2 Tax=Paracoccus suum TaxID=2259340 RepID=A0A344PPH7_9RHOB|nr:TPM domain-containing protein [Paracoccus suum]